MKFNSREIAQAAALPNPDKEGKLAYKKPQKATGFKDKWFRLKGNLLFYYSWETLSTSSTFDFSNPQGVIILERIRVQHEPHHPEQSFVFSVSFESAAEAVDANVVGSYDYIAVARAKHYFSGRTLDDCEEWVNHLRHASTETLRSTILVLQAKILKCTGVDPLESLYLNPKVEFRNTGGGLKLRDVIDDFKNPESLEESTNLSIPTIEVTDSGSHRPFEVHCSDAIETGEAPVVGKGEEREKMLASFSKRPLRMTKSADVSGEDRGLSECGKNRESRLGTNDLEPRAPPRRKDRSRPSTSAQNQLSLIEEDMAANALPSVHVGLASVPKDEEKDANGKMEPKNGDRPAVLDASVLGEIGGPKPKPRGAKWNASGKPSSLLPPSRSRKRGDKVVRTTSLPVKESFRSFIEDEEDAKGSLA